MHTRIIITILLILLLTACHHGNPWAQKTVDTLDLIRAHLVTEAPGPVDVSNPAFMKNMAVHYQEALVLSKQVHDASGYHRVIEYFMKSFDDSNIRLSHFPDPGARQMSHDASLPFTLQHLTPTVVWISIPSFLLENGDEIAWAKKIISLAPSLRDDKTIVIDLRGNAEGDVDWGAVFLQNLYGVHDLEWRVYQSAVGTDQYRVSDYAVSTLQEQTKALKQVFGQHSAAYRHAKTQLTAMRAVLERGDQLYPATVPLPVKPISMVVIPPLYKGSLILITDGACNNACLNFIALAKQFPRVSLLGQPTNANTFYTHSSVPVYLDDGVELHFGYVIERNRLRASHQAYVPDMLYSGNMKDTPAVKQWVLTKL